MERCWADLAGFPKRETRGCLIGCACCLSFAVSTAVIDLTCSKVSTMLGDKVELEFKKPIYFV